MASNGSYFMITRTVGKKSPLAGRPNTESGDYGTPKSHNYKFVMFYHV